GIDWTEAIQTTESCGTPHSPLPSGDASVSTDDENPPAADLPYNSKTEEIEAQFSPDPALPSPNFSSPLLPDLNLGSDQPPRTGGAVGPCRGTGRPTPRYQPYSAPKTPKKHKHADLAIQLGTTVPPPNTTSAFDLNNCNTEELAGELDALQLSPLPTPAPCFSTSQPSSDVPLTLPHPPASFYSWSPNEAETYDLATPCQGDLGCNNASHTNYSGSFSDGSSRVPILLQDLAYVNGSSIMTTEPQILHNGWPQVAGPAYEEITTAHLERYPDGRIVGDRNPFHQTLAHPDVYGEDPWYRRASISSQTERAQSAPKNPKSLVKKFIHVFKRSSSSIKDAESQGTSHRLQDPASGPLGSNVSASPFSQLASSPAVATPPATTSTLALSSVQRRIQPTTLLSTLLLDASSPPAPQPSFANTPSPATTFAPPRSTFRSCTKLAPNRSSCTPKVSSPLVPPQSVATTPATAVSSAHSTPQRSTPSITPHPTYSSSPPGLLAPPRSAATTPATHTSPAFASFQRSKPTTDHSLTSQLIAELQATAANLDWQYNEWVRDMHSVNQDHVFPHTISHVNETDSATKELKAIRERIAAAERDCGRF
ncbi:hypothetical protein FRC01_008982, partial [Tulasnella sp. 417]